MLKLTLNYLLYYTVMKYIYHNISKVIYGLCAYANITAGVVHSRASFHLGTGKVLIWKRFFMYVHRLRALHQCKSCIYEDQESNHWTAALQQDWTYPEAQVSIAIE